MDKKCSVVMLSTNEKACKIWKQGLLDKLSGGNLQPLSSTGQHLYITSDDEIKEGDWAYCNESNPQLFHCNSHYKNYTCSRCKKIIATTDTSLKVYAGYDEDISHMGIYNSLPQPSQSFIEKYITEYNKGNVIDKVMVEYEEYTETEYKFSIVSSWIEYKLKVSKDNTITIKKVKDSWTRDEVIALITNAINYGIDGNGNLSDRWINQNL